MRIEYWLRFVHYWLEKKIGYDLLMHHSAIGTRYVVPLLQYPIFLQVNLIQLFMFNMYICQS